jgi:DnaJ family protein C protein 28
MPDIERGIEAIIRKAMEEGAFDNLRGKGKPFNLNENPLVESEWRMAFSMLQNEGFLLPWMDKRNQIEEELTAARQALARAWEWRQEKLERNQASSFIEGEWAKAQARFREKITDLNKRIENYNLEVPATIFQRGMVDAEKEFEGLKDMT